MIYLLSEKRLKADFLNDNIASELILPSIQTAQDIYLRQTLGDKLLNTICEQVQNNNLNEPIRILLDEYIIIYLEYLTMAELCVPSTFKLGNIGVAQAFDNNVNTQSIQNVKYLESYYKQKASTYENRLVTYIKKNINLYPEYINTTEVTTAKESTLQTGLYLGGTSRTTTSKGVNTTSNSNYDKQYISYIKPQRLTNAEKAQARENMGVDVDSANFYTKDDIDVIVNGIEQSIPSKTSDLTLDNVYNKTQVDTLISNVPTFSGDYNDLSNKPDIYTKSEVDNLIENVDVDLSDYYTKEQVYSRNETYSSSQVDTLISQVPTFSGNYNDLENKPTLFSGSYNDLSDKPQIYTKQETYSKEEVNDLIGNSGSDTNANIVDILSLDYEEQLQLINYVIDNNSFPNINTLYIYRGYILNNLERWASWWDEALNQKIIIFNLYAHPKSYDIRFITSDDGYGKIYNDFFEKGDTENLVKKGELSNISYNDLNNKPITDLLSLPNNQQVDQIDFYADTNMFMMGISIMTIEGIILNGNKCVYEVIDFNDSGMPIKQVDFHINRTKDSFIIRFITRYGEDNENIPYEFIYTNENGDMLDGLNLVTKSELDETLGDINNLLEQI